MKQGVSRTTNCLKRKAGFEGLVQLRHHRWPRADWCHRGPGQRHVLTGVSSAVQQALVIWAFIVPECRHQGLAGDDCSLMLMKADGGRPPVGQVRSSVSVSQSCFSPDTAGTVCRPANQSNDRRVRSGICHSGQQLDRSSTKTIHFQRGDQITQGGVSASPGNGEVAMAIVNYCRPILSLNSEDYVAHAGRNHRG